MYNGIVNNEDIIYYPNDPRLLFRKYEHLITTLARKHGTFRDFVKGKYTHAIPKDVHKLLPNGYILFDGKQHQISVAPGAMYVPTLAPVLAKIDLYAPFIKNFQEAEDMLMYLAKQTKAKPDFIPYREIPHLFKEVMFASYTGSPQTGGGGENVTTCKNIYNSNADVAWATLHDSSTGTVEVGSTNTVYLSSSGATDKWSLIVRNFHSYDLTEMGAGATISGTPTIGLYVTGKTETLASQSYNIYGSTQANANDVVAEDFDQALTTALATAITGAALSTSAVNNWNINAAGITALEAAAGGVVKFSVRLVSDATNTAPTWSSAKIARIGFQMAADANPPLLTATYTAAATTSTSSSTSTTTTSTSTSTSTTTTSTSSSTTTTSTSSSTTTTSTSSSTSSSTTTTSTSTSSSTTTTSTSSSTTTTSTSSSTTISTSSSTTTTSTSTTISTSSSTTTTSTSSSTSTTTTSTSTTTTISTSSSTTTTSTSSSTSSSTTTTSTSTSITTSSSTSTTFSTTTSTSTTTTSTSTTITTSTSTSTTTTTSTSSSTTTTIPLEFIVEKIEQNVMIN